MIKAREYYSDVYWEEDDEVYFLCEHCGHNFQSGDLLLKVPDKIDYDEKEILEHCPMCKKRIYKLD